MMLRRILLIIILTGLTTSIIAQKSTDTELWTGGELKLRLTKKLKVDVDEQFRFNDTISSFKAALTEIGLKYKLDKGFSLKGNFRFARRSNKSNRNRFSLDVNYDWDKKEFPLSIEYRLRFQNTSDASLGKNFTYVRNRIGLDYNLSKLVDPFLFYELYFRLNGKNEFRVTRFTFGLDWKMTEQLDLTTYYRIDSDINVKKPKKQNIIGVMLSYDLDLRKKE